MDAPDAAGEAHRRAARDLWMAVERIHAVIYFADDAREAVHQAGVPGFWRAYFAARGAPLGPVPPEVVTALFFGFHPATVARAVPDVWTRCPPERIVAARRAGSAAALERLAGAAVPADAVVAAADAVERAAARLDTSGRPLGAANQAVDPGDTSWERLWQGCTTIREHRGDGHVAAAVAAGLDGLEAHVLQTATAPVPRDVIQPARGWSDEDWAAATDRLRSRGWLDASGTATPAGHGVKARVEAVTDGLAARDLTPDEVSGLTVTCGVIADALDRAGYLRFPNPMGLPPVARGKPGSGL